MDMKYIINLTQMKDKKKTSSLVKYVITYNQDYGADIRHKREVYINGSEAIKRYEVLKRNSDVCDLDINGE